MISKYSKLSIWFRFNSFFFLVRWDVGALSLAFVCCMNETVCGEYECNGPKTRINSTGGSVSCRVKSAQCVVRWQNQSIAKTKHHNLCCFMCEALSSHPVGIYDCKYIAQTCDWNPSNWQSAKKFHQMHCTFNSSSL